ncbi:unnamed protein product [Rotaria sordida]|uniref:Uncharacterized protein n=1 Tax=Rotaria sordida TaxID=392033 RepID=A0A819ZRG0_9BILA|nr:unnamed protein product [Rotaria sordida]
MVEYCRTACSTISKYRRTIRSTTDIVEQLAQQCLFRYRRTIGSTISKYRRMICSTISKYRRMIRSTKVSINFKTNYFFLLFRVGRASYPIVTIFKIQ